MSNTQINKSKLEDYLSDFHPIKADEFKLRFKDFNFDIGPRSFLLKMTKVIGMPKIGKSTLNYWISRGWTLEESKLKRVVVKKDPSTSPMNINFWIKRGFNEEESIFKIKSQRKLNKEYWIDKGYSEQDSLQMVNDFQKENNSKFQFKLNNDLDFRKNVDSKRSTNINYWLNLGHSLEDSKKLLSDRQRTFSLEKCIEKYGDDEGQLVWKNRQEKWTKTLLKNGNLKNGFSKISLELFDSIYDVLNDIDKQYVKYHSKNGELFISKKNKYFLYDFNLKNKIIEFNGDIYHGNPNFFKEDDICINYKIPIIAKDAWSKDKIKIDLAKSNGFDVLTIWESEYKKDKKSTLEKCLEFLKIDKKIYEN